MTLQPWQKHSWQQLQDYITQDRVPQALLISGDKGLGKVQLATQFAHSLLCINPTKDAVNCGCCTSCHLLKAHTHPDLIKISPEEVGKNITINQIRQLVSLLSLKPQFDRYRVVILHPAEQLNNASANAFLKYLEEPTERTILILVTDSASRLPATILSRCQKLSISKPDKQTTINWLRNLNPKLTGTEAEVLHQLSLGSPFEAHHYDITNMISTRNDCFKAWLDIAQRSQHPIVIAENWNKLTDAPLFFWITTWVVDMIRCKHQAPTKLLYNPDLQKSLSSLVKSTNIKEIYKLYDLILNCRLKIDTQINKQSMFEEILITWLEISKGNV